MIQFCNVLVDSYLRHSPDIDQLRLPENRVEKGMLYMDVFDLDRTVVADYENFSRSFSIVK